MSELGSCKLTDCIVTSIIKSFLLLQKYDFFSEKQRISAFFTPLLQMGRFSGGFVLSQHHQAALSIYQAAPKRFVSMRSHTANRSSAAGEDL